MTEVIAHIQANAKWYITGVAVAIPLVIITRKHSLRIIQYLLETIIYLSLIHLSFHFIVAMGKWFKEQSSFDRAFGRNSGAIDWQTPLTDFWKKELYSPTALFYIEMGIAILVIILVLRYRPLRFKKPKSKKQPPKKAGTQYKRPDYSWKDKKK